MTRSHFSSRCGPLVLLAGFSLFWFSDTIADPDLWGHIRFGQDILETGSIVQIDRYSYRTGDQPWINHEWLSEVIFAFLYDRWGAVGLVVFKVLLSLVTFGLLFAHLGKCGLGPWCSVALLVLLSIPFRMGLGTVRPQIFTYFCFLTRALSPSESREWARILALAHADSARGLGQPARRRACGGRPVRVMGHGSDRDAPREESGWLARRVGLAARLGLIGIACGLALLLNPYGSRLVFFLLRTATIPRPEIGEWAALSLVSLPGLLYLILLAIGIAGLAGSGRRRSPETIVIFSVAAAASLDRPSPLSPFCADAGRPGRRPYRRRVESLAAPLPGPIGSRPVDHRRFRARRIGAGSRLSVPRFGCIRVEPFYFAFPARAVALLEQSGVSGNMAVPFDWGEYVLWHLGPRVKVSDRRQA